MGRLVDVDDLIDAREVARLLGLSQANNVHLYQRRYPDMPRPVYAAGARKAHLWSRAEITDWARATGRSADA